MYQQQKIHSGFIGLLFMLAAVLLFFFHTKPALKEVKNLESQLTDVTEAVRLLKEGAESSISESSGTNTLSEVERKQLEAAIPLTIEQDVIVRDLNRIAKAAGIAFSGLTFNLQRAENLEAVNISASFQGTSSDVARFLKLLEVNPRTFVVKNAGVSSAADSQSAALAVVTLNMTLQAYFQHAL